MAVLRKKTDPVDWRQFVTVDDDGRRTKIEISELLQ